MEVTLAGNLLLDVLVIKFITAFITARIKIAI